VGFQVHTREIGRVAVIDAVGRLTLTDGHTKLRDEIHVLAATGTKKFILNLARVDAIDSYGVGELARCYSIVRRAGGEMKLAALSRNVLEVLEISRLTTILEIYPEEAAAVRAFEAGAQGPV
jgi:anti-sigma B factor antagonist